MRFYYYFPMIASLIYHLAENKGDLVGIPYLNKYAEELLLIDRFFALCAIIFVITQISKNLYLITPMFIRKFILGLSFLIISDGDMIFGSLNNNQIKISPLLFTITHTLWHFLAFSMIADVI